MIIILIMMLITVVSFTITKIKNKCYFQINTMFTLLWCIIVITSKFDIIGLITPSNQIYLYIIFSVILFNTVFWIGCKKSVQSCELSSMSDESNYKLNYRFIIIINIIAIMLISPLLFKAIQNTILHGNFGLRSQVGSLISNEVGLRRLFDIYIKRNMVMAIIHSTAIVAAVDLSQRKKKLLPIAILGQISYILVFGGRTLLFTFMIAYFVSVILTRKYFKIKIKKKYIVVSSIILILVTVFRGMGNYSLLQMISLYFAGSLSYLQLIIDNPLMFGLDNHTWGMLTFGFIADPIVLFIKLIFGVGIDAPVYQYDKFMQPFVNIGNGYNNVYYNNNSTIFYPFLRDFGVVGLVVGNLFLSIGSCILQSKYVRTKNLRNFYLLIYMYIVIFNSSMSYKLRSTTYGISIIILILCVKKIKGSASRISSRRKSIS